MPESLSIRPRVLLTGATGYVVAYESGRRVRLQAEMRLPGRTWLEFAVVAEGAGARIWQTAAFDPRGLLGRAYW